MANANRQFQVQDPDMLHTLVRAQPLATLVIAHAGALHANHVPLFLDPDRGPNGTLVGHVARANGVWPLLPQKGAVAVFHGPQAYVSPSWYPSKALDGKQVPTWNYAAVHAHGTLSAFDGYHDGEMYACGPWKMATACCGSRGHTPLARATWPSSVPCGPWCGSRNKGMWLACSAPSCAMTSVASGCVRTSACRVAGSVT